ncbi:MAG: hypothetical protein M3P27_00535 [Acidobacteriota bacterium]|nr:hypothetical protein [Acidobacteriota bacterium]
MSLFHADAIVGACADPGLAATWWEKAFDCRRVPVPGSWDDSADCVALQFPGDDEPAICLSPKARDQNSYPVPVIFTGNIKKAYQGLLERGVVAGPIQGDDPKFFELRDGEGNTVEVSEEP